MTLQDKLAEIQEAGDTAVSTHSIREYEKALDDLFRITRALAATGFFGKVNELIGAYAAVIPVDGHCIDPYDFDHDGNCGLCNARHALAELLSCGEETKEGEK